MLYKITLLTTYVVAVLYPLGFLINMKNPLKEGFHRFHTGLPLVISGVLCAYLFYRDFEAPILIFSFLWCATLAIATLYYWNKDHPHALIVNIPTIFGIIGFIQLQNDILGYTSGMVFIGLIGGLIFCATLFAMNLGHWYLNVHGLPLAHLINTTKALGSLLLIRLGWDVYQLIFGRIIYQGDMLSIGQFSATLDGFLLFIGLFFGVVFPLISLYFVLGTLKVKSTQSATGILYVTLCSVLLGDMAYKYYMIKYNVIL